MQLILSLTTIKLRNFFPTCGQLFLMFFLSPFTETHSFDALKPLQKNIIELTQKIQKTEKKLNDHHSCLLECSKKEEVLLKSLNFDPRKLMITLHYLRHLEEYSPTLAILSSQNSEDLINALILMRSFIPELANQHKETLLKLKNLSKIRHEKIDFQKNLLTCKKDFEKKKSKLLALISQKQHLSLNFGISANVSQKTYTQKVPLSYKDLFVQYIIKKDKSKPVVDQKNSPFTTLVLLPPTSYLAKKQVEPSSPTQAGTPTQACFLIKNSAPTLITAPCAGTVLFTFLLTSNSHFIILKQNHHYIVLTGISVLHCQKGQAVLPGEPLGQILPSLSSPSILTMELWDNAKKIDPFSYMKEDNA